MGYGEKHVFCSHGQPSFNFRHLADSPKNQCRSHILSRFRPLVPFVLEFSIAGHRAARRIDIQFCSKYLKDQSFKSMFFLGGMHHVLGSPS